MLRSILILSFSFLSLFGVAQSADFSFQSSSGSFCNPVSVQFTQNCTGNPVGFVWDFGNNTRGFGGNVSATYNNAGTYTVKLTAIYDQLRIEVYKTVVINPGVSANLAFDRNYICQPGPVNFTASSSGKKVKYDWDFGDGATLSTASGNTAHTYAASGNYTVSLNATDTTGCAGTAGTTVQVKKPPVVATVSPTSGCIPANAVFTATATVPVNDFVTKYIWDFNDGSPIITTAGNTTSHLYTAVGGYAPTLNIVTSDGCTNSYKHPGVGYGTPPVNHVAYAKKDTVCGSETPVFVSKAKNANYYVWDFGDGTTAGVNDTLTQHKYATLGSKTVTVTPYFNDCPGTTISFPIVVVGIIASYNYSNICTDRKTYSFVNTSQGNLSAILWTFGDGKPNDTTKNVTHSFPDSGQFVTTLKATDSLTGCTDSYQQNIFTARPVLVNPDSSICRNANSKFSVLSNYTNPSAVYAWNVAGIAAFSGNTSNTTVQAGVLGNFNNFVVINYGPQSCPDTIALNHSFLVRGPNLSFTAPASICFNTLFSVTNTSKPFITKDSVKLWYWNFGSSSVNDTIYQPLPVKYNSPGSFNVKLTAADISGCIDSLSKVVTVNPIPFLVVVPKIDTLCAGQSDTLRAFSSDPLLWSPSNNLSCTTCDSAIANPAVSTNYIITATTPLNCSIQDTIVIKVYSPFTATVPAANLYICRNDTAKLDVDPKMKRVVWAPATALSNPSIYNPTLSPIVTTVYTATLTDSVGCFTSSASVNVNVKSLPTVNAGPDRIVPYNSPFTITPIYSNNVTAYKWSPQASLNCTTCASTNGIALTSQTYQIKVTSDSACISYDSVTIFVECKYANLLMPTAFTPNNDNLNDTYYPVTRGIKSIVKFAIYNRQGQVVYEAKNAPPNSKAFAWTGDYKGQFQPAGAYVYVLAALCELGETITKSGSFILLR